MDLYIYNGTKQQFQVADQVKEAGGPVGSHTIPPGQQLKVVAPDDEEAQKAFLGHHERYGTIPFEKIDDADNFVGTCYSKAPIKIGGEEAPIVT